MVFAQALLGIVQAIGIIRLGTKFRRTDRLLFVLMRDHIITFVSILGFADTSYLPFTGC